MYFYLHHPLIQIKFLNFLKITHPNGTSSIEWSDSTTTDPILSDVFDLKDFVIDISHSEDRKTGNVIAKWNHTYGCVKRYAIALIGK